MEILHVLPVKLFMQESDNLASVMFEGFLVDPWLSGVYRLRSEQSSPLLQCHCLFSDKVKPSASALLFHSQRPKC